MLSSRLLCMFHFKGFFFCYHPVGRLLQHANEFQIACHWIWDKWRKQAVAIHIQIFGIDIFTSRRRKVPCIAHTHRKIGDKTNSNRVYTETDLVLSCSIFTSILSDLNQFLPFLCIDKCKLLHSFWSDQTIILQREKRSKRQKKKTFHWITCNDRQSIELNRISFSIRVKVLCFFFLLRSVFFC